MKIKKAKIEDLQQILKLETKIWDCQVTSIYDMANFVRFGYVFVAKDKTKILGAIIAIKTNKDEVFVEDLIVDKKYRNKGIGTKLKQKLISSVKLPMIGFVSHKFKASLRLQKRLGFKIIKKVKDPYMRNKKEYVFMFRKGI